MRVAVVEDEDEWADIIGHAIREAGWTMVRFTNGEMLIDRLRDNNFDVIVMDVVLRSSSRTGIEFVKLARALGNATPILMLTNFSERYRVDEAIYAGADDHVAKPFDQAALVARIHRLGRKGGPGSPPEQRVGKLLICRRYRIAHYDGKPVTMRDASFDILSLLCDFVGEVVSHETLWARLWPEVRYEPQPDVIQQAIYRLREDLKTIGASHIVRTVRARGYMISPAPPYGISP